MKLSQCIRPSYIIMSFIIILLGVKILSFEGEFICGMDVKNYFYWAIHFIKDQFLSGTIPLWNPYYYCGQPFMANPVNAVFYPSTFIFILFPLPWAFNLDIVIHLYLAAMGMYCFVNVLTRSKYAGLSSAIIYSMSGYYMVRMSAGHMNMYHAATIIPWIFYLIEKFFILQKPSLLMGTGFLLGVQILAGDPQTSYYTGFFLSVYFFVRYFFSEDAWRLRNFFCFGSYYLLIPFIAAGVSAIQILPTLEYSHLSTRAHNSFEFASFMSLPPLNFLLMVIPGMQTKLDIEYWGYIGFLTVLLALSGSIYAIRQPRSWWPLIIILFISVTITLGHYTPIYQIYYKFLPFISSFRIPARCISFIIFCIAVYAGFGIKCVLDLSYSKKYTIIMIVLSAILVFSLIACIRFSDNRLSSHEILKFGVSVFCSFMMILLGQLSRKKTIIPGIILIVLFVDLFLGHHSHFKTINNNELVRKTEYEQLFNQNEEFARVMIPLELVPMRSLYFKYFCASGYSPLATKYYFKFMHEMVDIPINNFRKHALNDALFEMNKVFNSKILGIQCAISKPTEFFPGYQFLKLPLVLPRATLVKDAVFLPDLEKHLEFIKYSDFNPEKHVLLLESDKKYIINEPDFDETSVSQDFLVNIVNYSSNKVELQSSSAQNAYLVLSDNFYPGWTATVDDQEVPILQANYSFRAIPLSSGTHKINFSFQPMSFYLGAGITLLTMLSLCFFFTLYLNRRKFYFDD